MNVRALAVVAVMIVVIGVGVVALSGRHSNPTPQANATTYNNNQNRTTAANQTVNSSKTLFSRTQYYPYSYVIYPGPISQQAQSALAGFNLTSTVLQNKTTKVTLGIIGTSQFQSMMLKPGYKLYIIETSFGDDAYHFDSSLGDDGFVLVDPNGYIA